MKNTNTLVKYAVLMALTVVMTMVIQIPAPAAGGYLNLGDMVIFFTAFMMGSKAAFVVGGLGSALADILLGWGAYAPITLVAKGLEGFIAGKLFETELGKRFIFIPAMVGGSVMAFCYYIAEIFMYGAHGALINLPMNLLQGLIGALAGSLVYTLIKSRVKTASN